MHLKTVFGWLALVTMPSTLAQLDCSPTSYFCLDPAGTEFNIVGPVNMFYSSPDRACIASPYSLDDACLHVTTLCNATYPDRCHGDCLAGRAVGDVLEKSCRYSTPISPPSSAPDVHHEIYFIRGSNSSSNNNYYSPSGYYSQPLGPGIPHQIFRNY